MEERPQASPFHLPALRQEHVSRGYLSLKNDLVRREPPPINPGDLIAGLRQLIHRLQVFLFVIVPMFLGIGLGIGSTLIPMDYIVVGIRVRVVVGIVGMMGVRIELPDPRDASSDSYGGVDLVLRLAGGFVDEDRSEGRASREFECTAAHCNVVRTI